MATSYDPTAWASHSAVTDPGAMAPFALGAAGEPAAIRAVSQELVTQYTGATDGSFVPVRGERLAEVDLRYAEAMLARLEALGGPLARTRPLAERIVGCCRDFTVLFVALARQAGLPARARVGYATYFRPGWYLDHVVAEVWDAGQGRWRLVEPEVPDAFAARHAAGGAFDPLDVPPDRFVTGPRAWQLARDGRIDPQRCVVAPDLDEPYTRGWSSLRVHVVLDLAALAKTETLLWDQWGLLDDPDPLARADLLDAVAAATADPLVSAATVADWAGRDGLALPPSVTSYSPAWQGPRPVDVRRTQAGRLRA